jgi:hypothetical protein
MKREKDLHILYIEKKYTHIYIKKREANPRMMYTAANILYFTSLDMVLLNGQKIIRNIACEIYNKDMLCLIGSKKLFSYIVTPGIVSVSEIEAAYLSGMAVSVVGR